VSDLLTVLLVVIVLLCSNLVSWWSDASQTSWDILHIIWVGAVILSRLDGKQYQ
jgi:hypothetical protein